MNHCDYNQDKIHSDASIQSWKRYIQFKVAKTIAVIDTSSYRLYQMNGFGDIIICLNDERRPFITVELKTRKINCERYYLTYEDIAIETSGNTSNLNNNGGSALSNCKADWFATAFYNPETKSLKHVHIFDLKNGLRTWLQENQEGYKKNYNKMTNGKYQGSWIAIPIKHIQQFLLLKD